VLLAQKILENKSSILNYDLSWYTDDIINFILEILCIYKGEGSVNETFPSRTPTITHTHWFALLKEKEPKTA